MHYRYLSCDILMSEYQDNRENARCSVLRFRNNAMDFNGSDVTITTSHVDNVTFSECFQRQSLCVTERIGHSAIVPAISVIGILLNGFTVYVLLSSRQFRHSSYVYLNGLAIADLLSLILFAVNGFGRGLYPANVHWRVFEVSRQVFFVVVG